MFADPRQEFYVLDLAPFDIKMQFRLFYRGYNEKFRSVKVQRSCIISEVETPAYGRTEDVRTSGHIIFSCILKHRCHLTPLPHISEQKHVDLEHYTKES